MRRQLKGRVGVMYQAEEKNKLKKDIETIKGD
jgi:hypothetical protein